MYLIGCDGGGTKTESVVTTLDGVVLASGLSGSSNPRSVGIEEAAESVADSIKKALSGVKKEEISFAFIGIPAFAEEFQERENEIKDLILEKVSPFLVKEIVIASDQDVAFASGTDKKDGVVVISGTGSVVRGWNKGKDVKTAGWGHFADDGGAFQVGQKAYRHAVEVLDGRSEKTVLSDLVLEKLHAENINDLNKLVYSDNPSAVLAPLSLLVGSAAEKGDEVAKEILTETSDYLATALKNTVKKLDFEEEFPIVLVGSMFKSSFFLNNFINMTKDISPFAQIIIPQEKPVLGAVKLAREIFCKE